MKRFLSANGATKSITTNVIQPNQMVETYGFSAENDGGAGRYWIEAGDTSNGFDRLLTANGNTAVLQAFIQDQTTSEKTWYVDPVTGSDSNNGTQLSPLKTLQSAWDAMPSILSHQQTIQLADGVYNSSSIPSSEQPRPSVLWGKGKSTTLRSTLSAGVLTGAVVIRGNELDRGAVKIQTSSDLDYGVYINKGNIGLQHLTIESNGVDSASGLLVSHRTDTYIHCDNVLIDGRGVPGVAGSITESTGQIELANNCNIVNCAVGSQIITDGDNFTMSGNSQITDCETGISCQQGFAKLFMTDGSQSAVNMIDSCTIGIDCVYGSFEIRGLDSTHRAKINSPIKMDSSNLIAVYSDTESTVTASNGSTLKYNAANFQKQIQLNSSDIQLNGSNSYTNPGSPNNDSVIPIALLSGSRVDYEGINNIVGSTGGAASKNPQTLTFNSDSETQSIQPNVDVYRVNGNGDNRTGCQIAVSDVEDGRIIYIDGDTWGVSFSASSTMDVVGELSIGNGTGALTGATLMFRDGKWRVVGVGQVRT